MPTLDELFNQAVKQHVAGDLVNAEHAYREILSKVPAHDGALHMLGMAAYQAGRHDEAVSLVERAILLNAGMADYHDNLGVVLHQVPNRIPDAIAAHTEAIKLRPNFVNAYCNRGLAYLLAGNAGEAMTSYQAALTIAPRSGAAYFGLGNALNLQGRHQEAVACYEDCIRLNSNHWEAYSRLGSALKSLGEPDRAIQAFRTSISLQPRAAETHFNQGNAYKELARYDDAISAYDTALQLKWDYPDCHTNRAIVLSDMGMADQAIAGFRAALSINKDFSAAEYNLSLSLLRKGEYEAGFHHYESRWKAAAKPEERRSYPQPQWSGQKLSGAEHTVFLYAEQGLGDTIQFARYASMVSAMAPNVILEVPRKLMKLLSALPGVKTIIAAGTAPPAFDFHCALMSLPGIFGTTMQTPPSPPPYLHAEDARRAHWKHRLGEHGFKIGIVWQGNPTAPAERGRSVPLAAFECLGKVPGVRLISLQKVNGLDQLDHLPAGMTVELLGDDFDSGPDAFLDTAAVMAELDLIISVDTAIVHVAGTMNRPTWIALQKNCHWIWRSEGEKSPWYTSTQLFRQSVQNDWDSVFKNMASRLEADIAGRGGYLTAKGRA